MNSDYTQVCINNQYTHWRIIPRETGQRRYAPDVPALWPVQFLDKHERPLDFFALCDPDLISSVNAALTALGKQRAVEPPALTPAINPKRSVFPDHIISLEDGRKFKSSKRHLGLLGTPDDYRKKRACPPTIPWSHQAMPLGGQCWQRLPALRVSRCEDTPTRKRFQYARSRIEASNTQMRIDEEYTDSKLMGKLLKVLAKHTLETSRTPWWRFSPIRIIHATSLTLTDRQPQAQAVWHDLDRH